MTSVLSLDVFFRIYYIQGKVAWAQHKSKTSQLKSKRADVLPLGIESFQYDVYLNPLDFDSWLSLALCHVNSAYEALSWSALEIKLHYADIKNHQIRAFHCFSQASQLYRLKHVKRGRGIKEALVLMVPPERTKFSRQEIAETLFYEFGRLCYSIVTQPMAGGAAHSKLAAVKQIWTKRMKLVKLGDAAAANQDIVLEDDDKSFNSTVHGVLRVGVWAFKRAIQLDSEEWRYPYMVARTLEKLHAEPEVLYMRDKAAEYFTS